MTFLCRTGLLLLVASIVAGSAVAKPWWMRGSDSNESDFLPPDAAFKVSSYVDGRTLRVRWQIAEGYYLYRERMQISAESPDLLVATPVFPRGTVKTDPYLGRQEIYTRHVEAGASYSRSDGGAHPIQIKVTYQGCAEAGLCYPPIVKVIFPESAEQPVIPTGGTWERYAILGGGFAFFLAGLLLRKGRRLDLPT